jgi:putative ABC transport system permease protein
MALHDTAPAPLGISPDQVENEMDEEIRYHIEKQTEEYTAQGMRPGEARAAARRAIGGLEQRKEECRDHRGVSVLENVLRDTKYAFRTLRRDIGFTIGVLLVLAVGIGADVAVFSIVNGILLRPLPYRHPDRLFGIQEMRSDSETGRSVRREKVTCSSLMVRRFSTIQ